MLGAIAGDIIGSIYEAHPVKTREFPLFSPASCFTDDTVLTFAVADHLLHGTPLVNLFHQYYERYPDAGYGGRFVQWARDRQCEPYNSWGNGSAMRASPIGFAFNNLEQVLHAAKTTAEITHNHPEGIKGAQAAAAAVFLARTEQDKNVIRARLQELFGYRLDEPLETIRRDYGFDVSCQGTLPPAIISFLEADSFEATIRNAVSLGGDADTLACIAGGIAQAYHGGLPEEIMMECWIRLDPQLQDMLLQFCRRFEVPLPGVSNLLKNK